MTQATSQDARPPRARHLPSEVGDTCAATGSAHPLAVQQRRHFMTYIQDRDDPTHCALEWFVTKSLPEVEVTVTSIAHEHAYQKRSGYNTYARALAAAGIPMTPAAEMVYLAERLRHVEGELADRTKEQALRRRVVELLAEDEWLCHPCLYIELWNDPNDPTEPLPLMGCGLIGPELEPVLGLETVKLALASEAPIIFESDILDDDQALLVIEHAALVPMLEALTAPGKDILPGCQVGRVSNAASAPYFSELFSRVIAGAWAGSIAPKFLAHFCDERAFAAHIEGFIRSNASDFTHLERSLGLVEELRVHLNVAAPALVDSVPDTRELHLNVATRAPVFGIPPERFWPAALRAAELCEFTFAPGGDDGVEEKFPSAWQALMALALGSGVRSDTSVKFDDARVASPFSEECAGRAGPNAFRVFSALEIQDAMTRRVDEVLATAKHDHVTDGAPAPRRRRLGV
jgi:hypothetical protein